MRQFSKTADYHNEREHQKQNENEDFDDREPWGGCARGQLPQPLLRLANRDRLTNSISRFATRLFLSSPGWNKRAAGATNLIVEDIVFSSFYFDVWSDNRPSRLTANHKLEKAVVFTRLATR